MGQEFGVNELCVFFVSGALLRSQPECWLDPSVTGGLTKAKVSPSKLIHMAVHRDLLLAETFRTTWLFCRYMSLKDTCSAPCIFMTQCPKSGVVTPASFYLLEGPQAQRTLQGMGTRLLLFRGGIWKNVWTCFQNHPSDPACIWINTLGALALVQCRFWAMRLQDVVWW